MHQQTDGGDKIPCATDAACIALLALYGLSPAVDGTLRPIVMQDDAS